MSLTVGDIFSGLGGFAVAAMKVGWRMVWFSEIEPYACRVLAQNFPGVPNLGNITRIEWGGVERPNVLCGGFPCQPHSVAGARGGSGDERDLWGECVRCLRHLRPDYAVFENVPGLLTSDGGGFFNGVLSDLAELGYDAEWSVLSACAVGAPHPRERLWIVAYPQRAGREGSLQDDRLSRRPSAPHPERVYRYADPWLALDDSRKRLRIFDGISLQVERNRLHALGNAVVPQVVVRGPFRRIQELEAEGRPV